MSVLPVHRLPCSKAESGFNLDVDDEDKADVTHVHLTSQSEHVPSLSRGRIKLKKALHLCLGI